MAIKEYSNEDLIFADINGSTLEVYSNDINKPDIIAGLDNNYNNYNSNDAAYE